MSEKTLASVDIGSNGARLLIKKFTDREDGGVDVKKLMFVRVPLRLGKDVFSLGKVSKERRYMMIHMMKGFKEMMKLYRVDKCRACATSAMRDAENGRKVMNRIRRESGIKLEILKGYEEAHLLVNNLVEKTDSAQGNVAYVDVGGGSTEISLLHDGALVESRSNDIGTLRLLADHVSAEAWKQMDDVLDSYAERFPDIRIIGSGGNINKLFKISNEKKSTQCLSVTELQRLYDLLKPMSIEERIRAFQLKDDRADVIVPAAEIFLNVAEHLKAKQILVPNISLADSIVDGLYRDEHTKEVLARK